MQMQMHMHMQRQIYGLALRSGSGRATSSRGSNSRAGTCADWMTMTIPIRVEATRQTSALERQHPQRQRSCSSMYSMYPLHLSGHVTFMHRQLSLRAQVRAEAQKHAT